MKVIEREEFIKWKQKQTIKTQGQIASRIARIECDNYFGDAKTIKPKTDGIAELRWKNGLRVYFTTIMEDETVVVILCGGNKNSQNKDITKARNIVKNL